MDDINGCIFNVGGGNEVSLSLLEATQLCRQITGTTIPLESDPQARPADLKIYISDNRKINEALGWKPKRTAAEILEDIYCWIKENERHIQNLY
ncbi:MAG: hypothetical protein KJ893_04080 [Candidatus Omnitrophica bacterium]|nr:hypothetical protein [Candidatus Omnitrophota bacterium]MCG2703404.1 hypothetical protein [Candidatus Omnitrophota bacterium]